MCVRTYDSIYSKSMPKAYSNKHAKTQRLFQTTGVFLLSFVNTKNSAALKVKAFCARPSGPRSEFDWRPFCVCHIHRIPHFLIGRKHGSKVRLRKQFEKYIAQLAENATSMHILQCPSNWHSRWGFNYHCLPIAQKGFLVSFQNTD